MRKICNEVLVCNVNMSTHGDHALPRWDRWPTQSVGSAARRHFISSCQYETAEPRRRPVGKCRWPIKGPSSC